MGFIYGLAVVLLVFEGIIIQCEGGGVFPWNMGQDPQLLTQNLIKKIIGRTGDLTLQQAIGKGAVSASDSSMNRILQNCEIIITTGFQDAERSSNNRWTYIQITGKLLLKFGVYEEIIKFFDLFGDKVKKIYIDIKRDYRSVENTKNINLLIKSYAKNIEELRIESDDDVEFWKNMFEGDNRFNFPKVRNFKLEGESKREKLELNVIFPRVKSLALRAIVADKNCLDNVKELNELELDTKSIPEDKLDHIFANNKNMIMICLLEPKKAETMHSIGIHLKNLITLELRSPGKDVLKRACRLPQVEHLNIAFGEEFERISFDMPKLKRLTFAGDLPDEQIVNFIKHFKKLEIVEFSSGNYSTAKCIEKLTHIKEFVISIHEDFLPLENMLKRIEGDVKFKTLKIEYYAEISYADYEAQIENLNKQLNASGKSIWTQSHVKDIETNQKYFMFKRKAGKSRKK